MVCFQRIQTDIKKQLVSILVIVFLKFFKKIVKCKLSNRIKELKVEQILYKRAYPNDE